MSHIGMFTPGSPAYEPHVALGRELLRRGHRCISNCAIRQQVLRTVGVCPIAEKRLPQGHAVHHLRYESVQRHGSYHVVGWFSQSAP
jgi:hypothetical protein